MRGRDEHMALHKQAINDKEIAEHQALYEKLLAMVDA